MAYATLRTLSFQPIDDQKTPIGEEEIIPHGGRVPDYVRPFQIAALAAAGVIVFIADDDPRLLSGTSPDPRANELPPALPNPEVPPTLAGNPVLPSLFGGPDELEAVGGASFGAGEAVEFDSSSTREEGPAQGQPNQSEAVSEGVARPSPRDSKAAWEDYAESQGVPRGEAESMTKADLISEVERRESQG